MQSFYNNAGNPSQKSVMHTFHKDIHFYIMSVLLKNFLGKLKILIKARPFGYLYDEKYFRIFFHI